MGRKCLKQEVRRLEDLVDQLRDDLKVKQKLDRIEALLVKISDEIGGMTRAEAEGVAAQLQEKGDRLAAIQTEPIEVPPAPSPPKP